jgi:hypothetical protein
LSLSKTKVTDAGLRELAGLDRLEWLALGGNELTDDGIRELTKLENLQELDLDKTKLTDVGLKELKSLKKLKVLKVEGTQVTAAGKREIKETLPGLKFGPWDGVWDGLVFTSVPMPKGLHEEPHDLLGWLQSSGVLPHLIAGVLAAILGALGGLGRGQSPGPADKDCTTQEPGITCPKCGVRIPLRSGVCECGHALERPLQLPKDLEG